MPRAAITGGLLVMSLVLATLALGLLPGTAEEPVVTMEMQEKEAQAVAREWMELLDAEDWAESYARTASAFREANTLEMWTSVSQEVRANLGTPISRHLLGADDVPSPQGYRVVRFRAQYSNNADAQETLSLVREDGEWKVAGIYVE